jgi:Spy/CpxP family protein refolding chaperone
MSKSAVLTSIVAAALFATLANSNTVAPYTGQESREIKALSTEDVQSYLSGKGMGFAKAAELNGYPGPLHVLELASELGLNVEQKQRTESLFRSMQSQAVALGRPLVDEESKLDALFSSKAITRELLERSLKRISELQAQVRQVHLETHLAQIEILTPAQVSKYMALRGYTTPQRTKGHSGHKH